MIVVFHGNNQPVSRKQFIDNKQSASNPISFDGTSVSLSDLTQALDGQSLFSDNSQIFIEEFFSKRKASKETQTITDYLTKQGEKNEIIFWESKELTSKQLGLLGKPEIKKFDIPKEVFTFLDSIQPRNSKQMITLFQRVLRTEEPEFVFFMLVRQFRMMLGIIDSPEHAIDEIKRLTWQKTKLIKQANAFGKKLLQANYDKLFLIESGMKTGQLPTPLEQAIDFFLATL